MNTKLRKREMRMARSSPPNYSYSVKLIFRNYFLWDSDYLHFTRVCFGRKKESKWVISCYSPNLREREFTNYRDAKKCLLNILNSLEKVLNENLGSSKREIEQVFIKTN